MSSYSYRYITCCNPRNFILTLSISHCREFASSHCHLCTLHRRAIFVSNLATQLTNRSIHYIEECLWESTNLVYHFIVIAKHLAWY